jgi:hypothetical protein
MYIITLYTCTTPTRHLYTRLESLGLLSMTKFDIIIKVAKEFVKPIHGHKTTQATKIIDVDEDDERACLVDNSGDKLDQCKLFKVVCGPCKYINPHSILSHLHAIACYHATFNSGFLYAWTCLAHKYALMSSLFLSLNNCLVSE